MFWDIARGMQRSASVKLLGRGSGVTSSCLTFELLTGRVTSVGVVIEWWWHLFMFWNIARGMKGSASVKLLGWGSGVTSSCLAFELSMAG